MKSTGKVVVVTGAGNGMGRQTCLELLRRGARVAGVDIKKEALDETKRIAGVTDEAFVPFIWVPHFEQKFGAKPEYSYFAPQFVQNVVAILFFYLD